MRQKAVSIAPQNEVPIQSAPIAAATPIVVELSRMSVEGVVERVQLDGREQALEVVQDAGLDVGALQDPAEDEEDQQREREQRQHEVVGDHPGQPGDVLLVGAVPEGAQETGRAAAGVLRCLRALGARRSRQRRQRSLPHRFQGAADEPHAERRRLGGDRDAGPRDLLDAAAPRLRRLRGGLRWGLVASWARRGWRRRFGRRLAALAAAGAAFVLLAPPAFAFFDLPSPRRGLRTPGRSLGRFPKTPRSPAAGAGCSRSSVIGTYSSVLEGRVRRRLLRNSAPSPVL